MTYCKRLATLALFFCIGAASGAYAQFKEVSASLDSLYEAGHYAEGEGHVSGYLQTAASLSSLERAELLIMKGMFSSEIGKFSEAEEAFRLSLEFFSTSSDRSSQIRAASILSQLAVLYADQGRYFDSRDNAKQQHQIYQAIFGISSKEAARASLVLSVQYLLTNEPDSANALLQLNRSVILSSYGEQSKEAARLFETEGRYYFHIQNYVLSERSLILSRNATRSSPGDRHTFTGRVALQLAKTRLALGNIDSALRSIDDALMIATASSGSAHPFTAECYIIRGTILEGAGRYADAYSAFTLGLETFKRATKENFRYSGERERLEFLRVVRQNCAHIGSTTLRCAAIYPLATKTFYNALLFEKGAVISNMQTQARLFVRTNDSVGIQAMQRLGELRSRLAAMKRRQNELPEKFYSTADSLTIQIDSIERALARRSAVLNDITSLQRTEWKEVQKKLTKGEAAIEVSRFPYYQAGIESDSIYYAGLVLTSSDTARPRLAVLGIADAIEDTSVIRQYFRSMERNARKGMGQLVAKVLWSGFDGYLDSVTTVTFSPDGIYHQLSLGALRMPNGKLLLENLTIQYVTSTRELISETSKQRSDLTASIFANPDFNYFEENNSLSSSPASGSGVKQLSELAFTKTEADAISHELQKSGYSISLFAGSTASEENLYEQSHPNILHIATHATFSAPQETRSITENDTRINFERSLLSSRLYLRGANTSLLGNRSGETSNDGIVTALEASRLDLHGTELVVLSACESGRGEIIPGEGVFGLTRAFFIAGTRSILLSLWQVPDRETKELMTSFYKEMLRGKSKPQALKNAQLTVRKIVKQRYGEDIPYYWAAFVLLGEK